MCVLKGWNRAATLIFIIIFTPNKSMSWVSRKWQKPRLTSFKLPRWQPQNIILVWSEQQRWIQSRFIFSSTTKSWETAHHSKTWNGCFCLINDSVDTSSGLSNNQVLFFVCFFSPKSKVSIISWLFQIDGPSAQMAVCDFPWTFLRLRIGWSNNGLKHIIF